MSDDAAVLTEPLGSVAPPLGPVCEDGVGSVPKSHPTTVLLLPKPQNVPSTALLPLAHVLYDDVGDH